MTAAANGNLTSDDNKGITGAIGITYNLLNLPQAISSMGTTYTYDATGRKLRRVITGATPAATEYIDGIQYAGTVIDFIQTEEGRALPNGAVNYNYEYTLTDHLGNSRVTFDSFGATATAKQVDDYYPFGMEILTLASGTKNEYLYNKKELQENLKLYDYGARFYDPVIARWTAPDPLAEFHYEVTPYNYAMNNPVTNIDIMGLDTASVKNINDKTTAIDYGNGKIVQLAPVVTIVGQRIHKQDNSDDDNNNSSFDFDKQAVYLDKHSFPQYIKGKDKNGRSICGHCALVVRLSLEAGGLKTNDRPPSTRSAKNYGPYLRLKGYKVVSPDDYNAKKGDIRVWQPYPGGDPNGHIDAYDGRQWVSDFKENPAGPGPGYRKDPDFEIYRRDP